MKSTVAHALIKQVIYPENTEGYLIISASDIGDNNALKFDNCSIPVLAKDEVTYFGQPILAVFSPDYESSKIFANSIRFVYEELPVVDHIHEQKSLGWGDIEPFFKPIDLRDKNAVIPHTKTVTGHYTIGQEDTFYHSLMHVRSAFRNKSVFIEAPTQWPFFIKEAVSKALRIPQESVKIDPKPYYTEKDEYLVRPAQLALITATASKISGFPCEIKAGFKVFRPTLEVQRKTVLSEEGKVVAEDIKADIYVGAYPVFASESYYNIICGLIPTYLVRNLSSTVIIHRTYTPPAHFCGDMSFPASQTTTEIHYTKVAQALGLSPAEFRRRNLTTNPDFRKYLQTERPLYGRQSVMEIMEDSGFERKYHSYMQQRHKSMNLNSLLTKARGIGIGTSPGLHSLSFRFKGLEDIKIGITLTAEKKAILNTSLPHTGQAAELWIKTISEKFRIDESDVSFTDPTSPDLLNSGPDVLSRGIGLVAKMVSRVCDQINAKRPTQALPITEIMGINMPDKSTLFESYLWAAAVVELEIDPILIKPVITRCWININCQKLPNPNNTESDVRRIAELVMNDLGAKVSDNMQLEIKVLSKEEGHPSTISQAIKGAVTSAFASALMQAVGIDDISLPTDSTYLLGLIRSRK